MWKSVIFLIYIDINMDRENRNYRNILLGLMIMVYLIPIIYVYCNFRDNKSVSSIICDDKCRGNILFFMGIMGLLTIIYELERKDNVTFLLIISLLVGIYGVMRTEESGKIHYIYAGIVFLSIFVFMARNCWQNGCFFLYFLLFIQFLMLISTIININNDIFYQEVLFLLNFAIFYLYLHYIGC